EELDAAIIEESGGESEESLNDVAEDDSTQITEAQEEVIEKLKRSSDDHAKSAKPHPKPAPLSNEEESDSSLRDADTREWKATPAPLSPQNSPLARGRKTPPPTPAPVRPKFRQKTPTPVPQSALRQSLRNESISPKATPSPLGDLKPKKRRPTDSLTPLPQEMSAAHEKDTSVDET
ncbi:MAG: hypothetical protein VYD19_05960, partial [Myxococcota bacterium]|nr:hypothetical protein [Myxococcota bacterium]